MQRNSSNAVKVWRTKMREMVKHGACTKITGRSVISRKSKLVWHVTRYWPDYGYYEISRTYQHETGREYTKSHLVSSNMLGINYVDNH